MESEGEPPFVNSVKNEVVVPSQANGVNSVDMVSPQTEGVNTCKMDAVSPRANNVNVDVVSPVASGINGVDVSGHVGVSPLVDSGNREDDLPRVSGMDVSPQTKVENDMDVSEHADTGNGIDGWSSVSDSDVTDDPQQLVEDVPRGNDKNDMDVSPTKSCVSGVVPPHGENANVGDLIPHVNAVNETDISQRVNSTSKSEVSPQNCLQSVNKRGDISQRPDREDANRRNASPPAAANGANRVDVSQHVKWSTNRIAAPHVTFAKGMDSSPPAPPRKLMPALLTSFEKEFIGESVKDNERKQREKERYLLTVSETRKELQQKGIDSLHQSLDMGRIKECLEWQRMMQDRFLYRNAEIRRSNSLKGNMMVAEEKQPKYRFRQADNQSLCPRLLSMDYPAGVRIRLRKKLEMARVEMRRLHQGPCPERERQPGEKDKQSSNAKEVLGELPKQNPVEKWNPRFGGFPPRPAVSAALNEGDSNENNMQHASLSRHSKAPKGNKTIGWSDLEPRSGKTSTNLKRSFVQSAKGPGRQREIQSPNRFPAPRRTMSAAEPVRPNKGVLDEMLRLPPPARTRARGDSGGERKFVADLIREAKQEAKDNPNIRTKPLVIYLP